MVQISNMSCFGSVDKTMDSQSPERSSWFESASRGSMVPLGRTLYPHCLVPRKGLKAIGPLLAYE